MKCSVQRRTRIYETRAQHSGAKHLIVWAVAPGKLTCFKPDNAVAFRTCLRHEHALSTSLSPPDAPPSWHALEVMFVSANDTPHLPSSLSDLAACSKPATMSICICTRSFSPYVHLRGRGSKQDAWLRPVTTPGPVLSRVCVLSPGPRTLLPGRQDCWVSARFWKSRDSIGQPPP